MMILLILTAAERGESTPWYVLVCCAYIQTEYQYMPRLHFPWYIVVPVAPVV